MSDLQHLRTFNFEISLHRSSPAGSPRDGSAVDPGSSLGKGAFQECSGLEIEMDVQELVEGGRNDGVIQRVGRAKYKPVVLKRGMFYGEARKVDAALWRWLQSIVSGQVPVVRYDGRIEVKEGNHVVATWSFVRGLPVRLSGPVLDAKNGDIAIEELHIAHEGLRLEDV